MTQLFWQHKLRSLLNHPKHPIWQSFCTATDIDREQFWQQLRCMENFSYFEQVQPMHYTQPELRIIDSWFTSNDGSQLHHASASTATSLPPSSIPISHLVPESILNCTDGQKVFWWFWRCYPESHLQVQSPLASIWSDCSVSAALAGSHLGYPGSNPPYPPLSDSQNHYRSQPFLTLFSLSPVLEFLQASHQVEDVWSSAWILSHLSSKICWKLAWKYGPDIFLQPYLYAQPWIDFWLLQHYPDFAPWIAPPSRKARLNAHFPNTLMLVLPDNGIDRTTAKGNPIWASMIYAEQILKQEWLALGEQVLADLAYHHAEWQKIDARFWQGWLEPHWQPSWVALPIVNADSNDNTKEVSLVPAKKYGSEPLITSCFLQQAEQTLYNVKQSRSWKLPTIFSLRSSLSGMGAVVHPVCNPHHPEGASTVQIQEFWQKQSPSYFDATEPLNAVEVLKRGLPQILPQFLGEDPATLNSDTDQPSGFDSKSIITPTNTPWLVIAASQGDRPIDLVSDTVEAELTSFAALKRFLHTFSHQLAPQITEHYQGNLLYACDADVLAEVAFPYWDQWLWQMYERYGQIQQAEREHLQTPPGNIHFGLVIASRTMPLSLILEQVWQAKTAAAQCSHQYSHQCSQSIAQSPNACPSSMVQIRVLEGQGSILTATAQFAVFNQWRSVVEQWQQEQDGINPYELEQFFKSLQQTTPSETYEQEAQNWLKLAVFHLR